MKKNLTKKDQVGVALLTLRLKASEEKSLYQEVYDPSLFSFQRNINNINNFSTLNYGVMLNLIQRLVIGLGRFRIMFGVTS